MATAFTSDSYQESRTRLEAYFDKTARKAWEDLTSDVPVSGIRATVRAGRDRMRDLLLSHLPADMHGQRLLDAGCGTGALAVEAARRGAEVVAVDVSGGLVDVARRRAGDDARIEWHVGDMRDQRLGQFDHVVAMDSLIHYDLDDLLSVLGSWSARTPHIVFTFAPGTPLLSTMHIVGKAFPRSDRSPAIKPISERRLRAGVGEDLPQWRVADTQRVSSGFYKSQAMELVRP